MSPNARLIARIFVSEFLYVVPFFALTTLVTVRLAGEGVSPWLIGLFGAAGWGSILVTAPLVPKLTRAFGIARAFQWASILGCVAIPLMLVPSLFTWFIAIVLVGAAGGVRWIVAEAWIADIAPPEKLGRLIGAFETMIGGTIVCGPLLLTMTGLHGWPPFAAATVLAAIAVAVMIGAPDPRSHDDAGTTVIANLKRVLISAPGLLLAAALGGVFEAGVTAVLPVQAVGLGTTAKIAALLVSVAGAGSLLLHYPLGWLVDRFDRRWIWRTCTGVTVIAAVALLFAPELPHVMWPAAFVFGGFGGGLYTLAMIDAGQRYSGPQLMATTAALVFAYNVGSSAGPALGGLALDAWPDRGLASLMLVLAALSVWRLRGR
ncbi:MAG: MFS transporter [Burkholderiales bacterium]|nr:MFS transporter [Burkholderiales bacterium]